VQLRKKSFRDHDDDSGCFMNICNKSKGVIECECFDYKSITSHIAQDHNGDHNRHCVKFPAHEI